MAVAVIAAPAAGAAAGTSGSTVATTIASETGEIVAGSMISRAINKTRTYAEKAKTFADKVNTQMENLKSADQKLQKETGINRGLIETATGWITDKITGKPARIRAVNNYLDGTLIPEFKGLLYNVRTNLVRMIGDTVRQEADAQISSMEQALVQMKEQLDSNKQVLNQRREELKSYMEIINGNK